VFSPANLAVLVFFSFVGVAAFVYGKKNAAPRPLVIGLALMAYGYFVSNVWMSLVVGAALTALIFYPQ
jgi:hypothetical protein